MASRKLAASKVSSAKPPKAGAGTSKRAADHYPRVEVASRAELRAWLARSHGTSSGAWIVTWKKHVAGKHVDAVAVGEEVLCFGWVDSLPRALDADRSMRLVTPRKSGSAWSRVNKERVAKLEAAGRMMPSGNAMVAAAKASGQWNALDAVEALSLPDDLEARFDKAPAKARSNFDAFPRSVKRAILEWIQTAKKPETRAKRVEETVAQATKNIRANQWRQ